MTLVRCPWRHRAASVLILIFFHTPRRPGHISWAPQRYILEEPNLSIPIIGIIFTHVRAATRVVMPDRKVGECSTSGTLLHKQRFLTIDRRGFSQKP